MALRFNLITMLLVYLTLTNFVNADTAWPMEALPASAASALDPAQFVSIDQHRDWQLDLDARGLRAAGSVAHEAYIDELQKRLQRAGVDRTYREPVELNQWLADSWGLELMGAQGAVPLPTTAYLPYSGSTSASGVVGKLKLINADARYGEGELAGKIVLLTLKKPESTLAVFESAAWRRYDPARSVHADTPYQRSYFALSTLAKKLDMLHRAGASAAIIGLEEPSNNALGMYAPYDAINRNVPALYVDQDTAKYLANMADGNVELRLTLEARIAKVNSSNLIGIIPGQSNELVVLNSHTDGPNGIEDNGPNVIVGMAQYLARLPRAALPRSIMILLSSGHFAGAQGGQSFIDQHLHDGTLERIAAVLCLEHLGAEEWVAGPGGRWMPTGRPEPYWFFMPNIPPLIAAAEVALKRADAAPAFIRPPTRPEGKGLFHDHVWPGEGQVFWGRSRIPTANYIAGPNYLFNWGISTADKVNYQRLFRETIAFTEMTLTLAATPMADLRKPEKN
ncbi:M28 family peptidase [Zhongshania sp.]|uniref:M28 family peptidase n=1 Tax=Zhongshania sp. TaxID=1971902 RepID=UPI00356B5CD8